MIDPNTTTTGGTDIVRTNWPVLALALLACVLDGYDTIALGLSVPSLSREWGVPASHFTPALSLTSLGSALGFIMVGRLIARFGCRNVMLAAVALFTLGTLLTAWASNVTELTALRLLTGLGLGAVMPAAITQATVLNPERIRQSIAVLVGMGMAVGALIAGVAGSQLIGHFGWSSVFIAGAVAAAVLFPFLWIGLPDERTVIGRIPVSDAKHKASLARLFDPEVRTRTVLLWIFSFLVFSVYYIFSSWLPTLLVSYGFTTSLAPLGSAALGVGSIVGAAILVVGLTKFRLTSILTFTTVAAAVFLTISAYLGPDKALLLLVFGGVGLGLQGGMLGQAAVAVTMYPQGTAATGVGWTCSMGRLGSVVGPVVGGALIGLGTSTSTIVLLACIPVLAALVIIVVLGRMRTVGVADPVAATTITA
ncbi:MFS transporter [Rhodococcus sp. 05-340-1]|uniref:MFS transporter n=1 Tax=unclassified Rhodococcus (in: high G+C Gram-positive bacteria) TaxID=192944 RepID=UPI000B9A8C74|nr:MULTISPECIES: MFS transporter [unclassified Rhodococcus (in: high G+C Gram-positive bacteria)]OZD73390.1 MFS transporter [Rhodococcus sp. 05-340-2]OZD74312.1 MFS transporter [Rhodococcus sp. 05-340-1]